MGEQKPLELQELRIPDVNLRPLKEEIVIAGDVGGNAIVIEPQPFAAAFKLLRYVCGVSLTELLGYGHPLVHPLYALQLFGHLLPDPELLAMGLVVK